MGFAYQMCHCILFYRNERDTKRKAYYYKLYGQLIKSCRGIILNNVH